MRWALLLIALCVGCAAQPLPSDRYFRIDPVLPAAGPAWTAGALQMRGVMAVGVVHERPLLYVRPADPLTIEQHRRAFWAMPPATLVEDAWLADLRARKVAAPVLSSRGRAAPRMEVGGRLLRFQQVLSDSAPGALVELELALRRDNRVIIERRYVAEATAASAQPDAVPAALSTALAEIFGRFAADATQALAAQPDA